MGIATSEGANLPYKDGQRWRNLRSTAQPAPVKVSWLPEDQRKPPRKKQRKKKRK